MAFRDLISAAKHAGCLTGWITEKYGGWVVRRGVTAECSQGFLDLSYISSYFAMVTRQAQR